MWGVFPNPDSAGSTLHFSPTCEEYIPVMWGVFPDPDSAGSSLHFSPTCEEYIPVMWGVFPDPDSAGSSFHFSLHFRPFVPAVPEVYSSLRRKKFQEILKKKIVIGFQSGVLNFYHYLHCEGDKGKLQLRTIKKLKRKF